MQINKIKQPSIRTLEKKSASYHENAHRLYRINICTSRSSSDI